MNNLAFYLSSYEYDSFAKPRRILNYKWGVIDTRDCLIAEVDLSVDGRLHGLSDNQITTLYIVNRFEKDLDSFKNLRSLPIEVHVLILKDECSKESLTLEQFKHIVWATLYDNFDDAKQRKPPFT